METPDQEFLQYVMLRPDLIANPYPMYERLRTQGGVRQNSEFSLWMLMGHAETSALLRDPRFSAARIGSTEFLSEEMKPFANVFKFMDAQMLFKDAPDHTRLRGLVSKAFTPRMIERMRDNIQVIVDELLDEAQAHGEMDVIRDFAYPLPTTVIAGMLGVPQADREKFKKWSDDFAEVLGTNNLSAMVGLQSSIEELSDYFRDLIKHRQGNEDDLLAALLSAEDNGSSLTEMELFANITLLLAAGHETTTNLIGNGVLALLRNPAQEHILREDLTLVPNAVEEFLRYESPVQYTGRVPLVEVTIGDNVIEAGHEVLFLLGAANRDPAQFANPEQLDVTRRDNKHVAFGFGNHFCLGAPLARVEGQIAFATLLRRFSKLNLAIDTPEYHANSAFHGLKALPVTW